MDKIFTIVYKTYAQDLHWLEYSLLSLQKFLNPENVLEIIIYFHDICYDNLIKIINNINLSNFINYRLIPVHYDYHGYIKQMVVKCKCYEDCNTKYIVILDCDLLLKEHLNLNYFIQNNGKIRWRYLKKEDDPDCVVFSVWKQAYEDSTLQKQNVHYMANGFPFIFTKESLKNANLKFIQMHRVDYHDYCKKRLLKYKSKVNANLTTCQAFDYLKNVFEEFEYLGFYCHNFSDDYIFISSNDFTDFKSFFIQNWSHGGITEDIKNTINDILK
jgi:hypothetical protein